MAKAKNKYYVVWRGRLTGIFDSWEECRKQTEGYEGAQYKGYPTLELAEAAHKLNYWQAIKQGIGNREEGRGKCEWRTLAYMDYRTQCPPLVYYQSLPYPFLAEGGT